MKNNEIGHFPYLAPQTQYSKDSYPREYIAHDECGKLQLTEDGNIKWITNWEILGEVEAIDIPKDHKLGKLLIDLQTYSDCFCANELVINGKKYIYLLGSGWCELGFPFYDDSFDIQKPYENGKGCYALIRGVARNKFVEIAKQDCLPSFKDVSTGDYKKDFVLPA